jgi:hypothetical protein
MMLALTLGRTLGSPVPLAAANEMMNACRGLGIDDNGFVVAHRVYQRLGGQSWPQEKKSAPRWRRP